jgi:tetratricopeptide (TPR) repeat protein
VQLAPQSAWAHYNLAYTLQYLGRPADALAEYGATASLDPGCVHCAYAMGGLFFQVGDLQRSLVTLNGYLAAARSVPAEARFIRSAFALRNEAGRRLAFAEAERQRALPVAPPAPDFAPREERAPEPSPPVSVAPGPTPLVRPPSADTAKHDQAIEAIFESVGGEVARRDGEERGGGWGVFEQIVGMAFRNDGIEKGLALAFPQLSDEARQYLEPLVISVFEGKLAPRDLAEAEFRSLAVDELKGRFKDEAQVIGIVDFLWDVKVKAARR